MNNARKILQVDIGKPLSQLEQGTLDIDINDPSICIQDGFSTNSFVVRIDSAGYSKTQKTGYKEL